MLGTNSLAAVAGTGCSLAEDTALRVGTTRHYTLSATRSGPGQAACTVTADTASRTITITFGPITINGLAATGSANAGSTYQDPFSVLGTNNLATVSGTGCSLAEDTALRVGSTRHYTLSATAAEAGEVICRITVSTVSQTASINFTAPPTPTPEPTVDSALGVPSWPWVSCPGDGTLLTVGWSGDSRASGYEAQEDGADIARWSGADTSFTRASTPGGYYRWRIRSTGPGNSVSAWSVWAGGGCPGPPPAPGGVEASCQNEELTVSWNEAGTVRFRATSYKPRIFTGNPMAESTKWTTNTTATTATIPASGEPDLPDSGVFQVMVKASNAAGDSEFSAPVDVTCTIPDTPSGLECTVVSDESITIEWNPVRGAEGYQVVASIWDVSSPPDPSVLGWEDVGIPRKTSSGKFVYEIDGLDSEVEYYLGVRARNASGVSELGTGSVRQCETIDDDWLEVDCNGYSALNVTWNNPPDSGQDYVVVISVDGSPAPSWRTGSFSGSSTQWVMLADPNETYRVSIASNGEGGPIYSQSRTRTCPELIRAIFDTPNLWPNEGGFDWPLENNPDDEYHYTNVPLSFLITGVPEYERSCTLSAKTWTCQEHWSEPMKVEVDEEWDDILELNDVEITHADGFTETEKNVFKLATNATIAKIASTIAWTSDKVIRFIVGRVGSGISKYLDVGDYILEVLDDERMFATIFGPKCLPGGVDAWPERTHEGSYSSEVGGYTFVRNFTIHYCQPPEQE